MRTQNRNAGIIRHLLEIHQFDITDLAFPITGKFDQGYLGERTFLFIKARCQPKQWRQDELELKITSMELLPDVKEKLIEKITILIPLSVLNKALITELAELTKERPGSTELYFKVRDEDSKMTVDLISRPVKLSVGRELITYLKERPDLEFRIN